MNKFYKFAVIWLAAGAILLAIGGLKLTYEVGVDLNTYVGEKVVSTRHEPGHLFWYPIASKATQNLHTDPEAKRTYGYRGWSDEWKILFIVFVFPIAIGFLIKKIRSRSISK